MHYYGVGTSQPVKTSLCRVIKRVKTKSKEPHWIYVEKLKIQEKVYIFECCERVRDVLLKYTLLPRLPSSMPPLHWHLTLLSFLVHQLAGRMSNFGMDICPKFLAIHASTLNPNFYQKKTPKELVLTRCTHHRRITPLGTKAANQQKTDKDLDNGGIRWAIYASETWKKSRGDDSRRWIDTCF